VKQFMIDRVKTSLPIGLREKLFNLGFQMAPDQFQKFAYQYGGAPKMNFGLTALRDRGFNPKIIFDVGAYEGTFCRMARHI